ncbi:MAG: Nif3-like dinuclear metal center hexameric protein [Candidatus Brocadiae bacterium]|nr:Nif3-like dinuclear metal center hexameric protein [Candidatus Brocadiia bacterium]
MLLEKIVHYLYEYFDIKNFIVNDPAVNELQVEASEEIHSIASAVDAGMETFEEAAKLGVQMLFVHHGLFWGKCLPITGIHAQRIAFLIKKGISLYAMHLPLDAHKEIGNNVLLAGLLDLEVIRSFGSYHQVALGVEAKTKKPVSLEKIFQQIEKNLNPKAILLPFGNPKIQSIGIVSGGGASNIIEADRKNIDLLITGEVNYSYYQDAKDRKRNVIFAGHYATETLGIKALGEHLAKKFNLSHTFIDLPVAF